MTDYAGRPVLVTGGAGFIGSHLVEELAGRGARVTVVDNLFSGRRENLAAVADQIELCELNLVTDDLRPLLTGREFDVIFHLAGNANLAGSVHDPRHDFETNARASFNLLEAVRAAAPRTPVVHTSTAGVYGEGSRQPIAEDDPTVPVSPYGISKLTAELYVSAYARLYGLRTANLRLFSVYGPRLRKQVIYDLMVKIRENPRELFIYGDGSQVRDFNHVANVVQALLVVAERARLDGDVYNVASGESLTIRELAATLCERMGASPRFVYSGDVRPGEAQRWHADMMRLKTLGYEPKMGIVAGLTDTVRWFHQDLPPADPVE